MMVINVLAFIFDVITVIPVVVNTIPLIGLTYIFYKWDLFNKDE